MLAVTISGCSQGGNGDSTTQEPVACAPPERDFARQAWAFSGGVEDVAVHCNTIYVAAVGTVGPRTGPLASVSLQTGEAAGRLPELSGDAPGSELGEPLVSAVVDDGSGGWFVGGGFAFADERRCPGIVHVLRSGRLDAGFCPRTNGPVDEIAYNGETVFLAGRFSTVGGQPRSGLAAVTTAGRVLSWSPELDPKLTCPDRDEPGGLLAEVRALIATSSAVYIGGFFSGVDGSARQGLLAVDPTTGRLLPFDAGLQSTEDCLGPSVTSLLATETGVVASGYEYRRAGEGTFLRVLDPASGREVTPRLPGLKASTLALRGSTLYAGGSFGAAAFDLVSGKRLPWRPQIRGEVCCYQPAGGVEVIVPTSDAVYLGGNFARVAGERRQFAAAVDGRTGQILPWDPRPNGPVLGMGLTSARALVGGGLTSVNIEDRYGLVSIDGPSGRLLPWAPRFAGRYGVGSGANALAILGDRLYVAGNFKAIDGQPRGSFASFDLVTHELNDWSPVFGDDPTSGVLALAVSERAIYSGGDFRGAAPAADEPSEPRVAAAAFDPESGEVLEWDPGLYEETDLVEVREIAVDEEGIVYLAGDIDSPRVGVLASDPTTGEANDLDAGLSADADTNTVAVGNHGVYVGGSFGLLLLDRGTGEVVEEFAVRLNGFSGIETISVAGGRLFFAGDFTRVSDRRRAGFAAVDAATGRVLPFAPEPEDTPRFGIDTIEVAGRAVIFDGYIQGNGEQLVVQPLRR